jgi:hypothetical protein
MSNLADSVRVLVLRLAQYLLTLFTVLIKKVIGIVKGIQPVEPGPPVPDSFEQRLVRPDDLLDLSFEFHNLRYQGNTIVRKDHGKPAWIIVKFPPQHIAEEAFFKPNTKFPVTDTNDPNYKYPPPDNEDGELTEEAKKRAAGHLSAGPSYLVFVLPDNVDTIPSKLESLLDWSGWMPLLEKNATNQFTSPDIPGQRTAIEAPFRLVLSPLPEGRWTHAFQPVTKGQPGSTQRTELWHTRLGMWTADMGWVEGAYVRAIHSPDYLEHKVTAVPPSSAYNPFRMSLSAQDRNQIVHLSANWELHSTNGPYDPIPITAKQLMLTSLGAFLNLRGDWQEAIDGNLTVGGQYLTLSEWQHRATLGRDQYVRVVYEGTLFPVGHRAALIKITERKVEKVTRKDQNGTDVTGPVAYLRQRMFLIVREPEKDYTQAQLPFQIVRILDRVTPDLDDPAGDKSKLGDLGQLGIGEYTEAFWPRVNDLDFQFNLEALDKDGRWCHFKAPLVFIDKIVNRYKAAEFYNQEKDYPDGYNRRRVDLHGQSVAFAPKLEGYPNASILETLDLTWSAFVDSQGDPPDNWPLMQIAKVGIPPLKQILGTADGVKVAYYDRYLDPGLGANKADAILRLVNDQGIGSPLGVAFERRNAGGLVNPGMNVIGVSRLFGPLSGYPQSDPFDSLNGAEFNPSSPFDTDTNLLGLPLKSIVQNYSSAVLDASAPLPRITSSQQGDTIETIFHWAIGPDQIVDHYPANNYVIFRQCNGGTSLLIDTLLKRKAEAEAEVQVKGVLSSFEIELAGVLVIRFNDLTFEALLGKKPVVHVNLDSIKPDGALKFISGLLSFLNPEDFRDPPSLDVTDQGIRVGYSLPIPSVEMGIFSMQNIKLSSGLTLPFNSDPLLVEFAFCERHNPFTLSVTLFGGGGFFHLAASSKDIVLFEMALEFGGNFSINLGVASGGIYCMGGIYFKLENGVATLAGYVRLGGELNVLCIASVSVEFYMELGLSGKEMYGQATLTVEVEVLFFSVSVDMSVERRFAGSDPLFSEVMDEPAWDEYCAAFAAYPE